MSKSGQLTLDAPIVAQCREDECKAIFFSWMRDVIVEECLISCSTKSVAIRQRLNRLYAARVLPADRFKIEWMQGELNLRQSTFRFIVFQVEFKLCTPLAIKR